MSRLLALLLVSIGVLGGALGITLTSPPEITEARVRSIAAEVVAAAPPVDAGIDEDGARAIAESVVAAADAPDRAAVLAIVEATLAQRQSAAPPHSVAQLDAATLNPLIEDYLLSNPRILQRVSAALETEIRTAEMVERRAAMASLQAELYDDADHIVLGNPDGDVTLIELFDYNCGYCRQALPDLAVLLAEDPNLRIILKEFPILSQGSVDAAKVGILVNEAKLDYWTFHQALFTSRGQIDKATALAAASEMGLNPIALELEMGTPRVSAVIDKSYRIAQELKITGTPTFIIGDEVIPGAVGLDQLRSRIANLRACGSTVCPPAGQPG